MVKNEKPYLSLRGCFGLCPSAQRTPYDVAYQGKDGDICSVSEPYKLCSCIGFCTSLAYSIAIIKKDRFFCELHRFHVLLALKLLETELVSSSC